MGESIRESVMIIINPLLPTLTDSVIMGPTWGISGVTLEYSDDSLRYLLGIF